jgi:hypothetical protein
LLSSFGVLLPGSIDTHFLAVVPVPLTNLVESHSNLISNPNLVLIAPLVTTLKLSN